MHTKCIEVLLRSLRLVSRGAERRHARHEQPQPPHTRTKPTRRPQPRRLTCVASRTRAHVDHPSPFLALYGLFFKCHGEREECNRWFQKYCTGLGSKTIVVGEYFSASSVQTFTVRLVRWIYRDTTLRAWPIPTSKKSKHIARVSLRSSDHRFRTLICPMGTWWRYKPITWCSSGTQR